MEAIIQLENRSTLEALQALFKELLAEKIVDALLLPMRTPKGTITPALVSNPDLLDHADPLAPVLAVNTATLAGKVSVRKPRARVGVVMRSCELRALVELTKMQQASLDDLLLIAIDCAGTYNVPTFLKKESESDQPLWKELFQALQKNPQSDNPSLRSACQICEQPTFEKAALRIKLLESDLDEALFLEVDDSLAEKLNLSPAPASSQNKVVSELIGYRSQRRDTVFTEIHERIADENGIQNVFAACIRCHNCMTVCPICYCKTCVFKSAVFDHEPMQYIEWSQQKGAFRMPADTMLFHLTRMNHMALSCVGCGMCTEACPAELPVGLVFRTVGQQLQKTFDYQPGRSMDEALPLVTFKADEWTEVGE
jgi:formate dehydrogenase subunit beta